MTMMELKPGVFIFFVFLSFFHFPLRDASDNETECSTSFIDLAIAIEWTTQTGEANFSRQTSFIKNVLSNTTIGQDALQVALLGFGEVVTPEFDLNTYQDHQNLTNAIDDLVYSQNERGANVNLAKIFFRPGRRIFSLAMGHRPNAVKVMIVLSEGRMDSYQQAVDAAASTHSMGIHVIWVSVGVGVDDSQTTPLASTPDLHFTVDSFSELGVIEKKVRRLLCRERPVITRFTVQRYQGTPTNPKSKHISVEPGKLLVFTCEAEGYPLLSISATGMLTGYEVASHVVGPRDILVHRIQKLVTIEADASDQFVCTVYDSEGKKVHKYFSVMVRGPPQFFQTPQPEQTRTIQSHGYVNFRFAITSNPTPDRYIVSRNVVNVNGETESENVLEAPDVIVEVTFERQNARKVDAVLAMTGDLSFYKSVNRFVLTVRNGLGVLDIPFTVYRENVSPTITWFSIDGGLPGTDVTVERGSLVRFQCGADASPLPSVSVSGVFSGTTVTRRDLAYTTDVTVLTHPPHTDGYVCCAINHLALSPCQAITLIVLGRPFLLDESVPDFTAVINEENNKASISFDVISNPKPDTFTLTRHVVYSNGSTEILKMPPSQYNVTFEPVTFRHGNLTLVCHVDESYFYEEVVEFTFTAGNSYGTLELSFDARLEEDDDDDDKGVSPGVVAGVASATVGLSGIISVVVIKLVDKWNLRKEKK